MIKIEFEFKTIHGIYRDALQLPDDHKFTKEEIQSIKQQCVDNWVASFSAPPVEAVVEDLLPSEEV